MDGDLTFEGFFEKWIKGDSTVAKKPLDMEQGRLTVADEEPSQDAPWVDDATDRAGAMAQVMDEGPSPLEQAEEMPRKKTALDSLNEYNEENGFADPFANPPAGTATVDLDAELDLDTSSFDNAPRGLPVGTYDGRLVGMASSKPSNSGDPGIEWTFEVVAGELVGRTQKHWTYVGPKTAWKTEEVKTAIGVMDQPRLRLRDVLHRALTFTIEEGSYNGRKTYNVGQVIPPLRLPLGTVITDEEVQAAKDEQIPF